MIRGLRPSQASQWDPMTGLKSAQNRRSSVGRTSGTCPVKNKNFCITKGD